MIVVFAGGDMAPPRQTLSEPAELYRYIDRLVPAVDGESGGFQCTLCRRVFNVRRDARNHVESIHFPTSFVYPCTVCGKNFPAKNSLNVHMYRHRKQERSLLFPYAEK